jgi:flagellin
MCLSRGRTAGAAGDRNDPDAAALRRAIIGAAEAVPTHEPVASKAPLAERIYQMTSILTNTGSMVALQTLKSVNKSLTSVQSEVSTGLKVATAKDNSSTWAIASTMSSDVASYEQLSSTLTSASAMVGNARSAAEQVADILIEIQKKIVQAENTTNADDLEKIQAEVDGFTASITSIAKSAQYNGINMVQSGATAQTITVSIMRDDAGALTTETFDIDAQDPETLGATLTVGTATVDDLDTLIDSANEAASAFGAAQVRIDAQNAFLSKQAASLKEGVGALVDADMEEAAARLTALQTQQQLGIQALSIANQAPQTVLSLFQ